MREQSLTISEIIDAGHGGGTGTPAGGDDDSGSSGGRKPVPRRAYFTALQLGLADRHVFHGVGELLHRAQGPWERLAATPMPPVVWFNTAILLISSGTIILARRKLDGKDRDAFRTWWWVTTGLGLLFLAGQIVAWRQLAAEGIDARDESEQPVFSTC